MGACDTLAKDGMIGGYWMIITEDKRILMEKEIYFKRWNINMPKGAKVITMLDMVQTIYQKAKNINERQIIIVMGNKAM